MGMRLRQRLTTEALSASAGSALKPASSEPSGLARLWSLAGERFRGVSIGARLAAVVLVTGCVTFGMIGALASLRIERGLQEQATALAALSKQQVAERVLSEADL